MFIQGLFSVRAFRKSLLSYKLSFIPPYASIWAAASAFASPPLGSEVLHPVCLKLLLTPT